MKSFFTVLLAVCMLGACTEREHISEAKKATGCELAYAHIGAADVKHVQLTPEKQAAVLQILAQLQPGDDSMRRHTFVSYSPDAIWVTICYTTSEGKVHDLELRDISTPEFNNIDKIDPYCLPDKLHAELVNLVCYDNNKEATHRAITEQNAAYMESKAAELQLIRHASAVRLEYRKIDSDSHALQVKKATLSPEAQQEILTLLPQLQLVPADQVVETPPHTSVAYRYLILTCGDREVALRLSDILPTSEAQNAPWQACPYLLNVITLLRLNEIASDPAEGPGQI